MEEPHQTSHSTRSSGDGIDVVFQIPSIEGGGAERKTALLASELADRGFQIMILTTGVPGDFEFKLSERVQRACMPTFLRGRLLHQRVVANIQRIKWARRFHRTHRPKAIVSIGSSSLLSASFAKLPDTRHLTWLTSTLIRGPFNSRRERFIRRISISKCDLAIAQTKMIAAECSKIGFKEAICIPNPILLSQAPLRRSHEGTPTRLVTVGRMTAEKRYDVLLDALALLDKTSVDWSCSFLGEGSLLGPLQEKSKALGLEKKVVFLGWVDDVRSVLRESDIFVMSSEFEGQPNALLEAMAEGLPCISTDFEGGGARELLGTTDAGILVPCNNVVALSHAIQRLIPDSKLREELGARGQDAIMPQALGHIADRWVDLLRLERSAQSHRGER